MISAAQILSLDEVKTVVDCLKYDWRLQDRLNLSIFRLSCCAGMRCKEIHGLDLFDFQLNGEHPYIRIRKEITKGEKGKRKARLIPMWWDTETYEDLKDWYEFRMKKTCGQNGPFIVSLRADHAGNRMSKDGIAAHWTRTISRALGPARARSLSIHKGRHSFTSLCHAAGIPLAAIRDALGHSSLAVTDLYCHSTDEGIRDVFGGVK